MTLFTIFLMYSACYPTFHPRGGGLPCELGKKWIQCRNTTTTDKTVSGECYVLSF